MQISTAGSWTVRRWKSTQQLDEQLGGIHLRRAIVVPNTKLAYMARIAFGEGDSRVFYSDIAEAIRWLTESA